MTIKMPLPKLRNSEYLEVVDQVLAIVNASRGTGSYPAPFQRKYEETVRIINDTRVWHKRDPAADNTEVLRLHDGARDGYLRALGHLWTAYAGFPDGPKKDAGLLLKRHLEVYGGARKIAAQTYLGETADIKRLLADYQEKPELRAALAHSDGTELIENIRRSNEAFIAAWNERGDHSVEEDNLPDNMKSLRLQGKEAYDGLMDLLDAFYLSTDGAEPWAALRARLNVLAGEVNTMLAIREGRAEAKNEPAPNA